MTYEGPFKEGAVVVLITNQRRQCYGNYAWPTIGGGGWVLHMVVEGGTELRQMTNARRGAIMVGD